MNTSRENLHTVIKLRCPACQKRTLVYEEESSSWKCPGCGLVCKDRYGIPSFYDMKRKDTPFRIDDAEGDAYRCPICKKGHMLPHIMKNGHIYWKCNNHECGISCDLDQVNGMPDYTTIPKKYRPEEFKRPDIIHSRVPCPICGKGHMVFYRKRGGHERGIWLCSDPNCHTTCRNSKNNVPDLSTVIHDFKPVFLPGTYIRFIAISYENGSYTCPFCREGHFQYRPPEEDRNGFWSCSSGSRCNTYCQGDAAHPDFSTLLHNSYPYIGIPVSDRKSYDILASALKGQSLTLPGAPITGALDVPDVADEHTTYLCPSCGSALFRRRRKKDGTYFWGCSQFPDCHFTANDVNGRPDPEKVPPEMSKPKGN